MPTVPPLLIDVEHCGRQYQALAQAEFSLQHQIRALFRALHGRERRHTGNVTQASVASSLPCSPSPEEADGEDYQHHATPSRDVPPSASGWSQAEDHELRVTQMGPVPAWLRQPPRSKTAKAWDGPWHPEQFLSQEPAAQLLLLQWQEVHAKVLVWEKRLAASVEPLPIWQAWCADVRGVSAFGLGRLLWATNDLYFFPTVAKLWKFLGVGLWNGEIQRRKVGITQAEAEAIGFIGWRRAIVYNLQDGLMKQNKICEGHAAQGCSLHPGPYRQVYLARKDVEQGKAPQDRPLAWHNRASRYMGKRFLRDLWVKWRETMPALG